jgi:hypothetical protein
MSSGSWSRPRAAFIKAGHRADNYETEQPERIEARR